MGVYQKRTLLLTGIATILRVITAFQFELSNAEVYYWSFANRLQFNYYDHPPMVAWLIRLTTANLLLHSEIYVRLGAIIASAISTWLMYRLGAAIKNERAGWYAALLYTGSGYASLAIGTFILPDSPQMIFWLAGVLVLIKICTLPGDENRRIWLWCLFGAIVGLSIMSKVHGVFLWFGLVMYLLLYNRNYLVQPGIYLAALVTLFVVSPIVIWNLQHDLATYRFHSQRVTLPGAGIHLSLFCNEFLAEIWLNNPLNFILIGISLFACIKRTMPLDRRIIRLLLLTGLPLIITVLFIAVFRETMAHWSGPGYTILLLFPAVKLAASPKYERRIPNVLKASLAYLVLLVAGEIMAINYYPGTLSPDKNGMTMGKDDVTLDTYGWKYAGSKYDSIYHSDVARHIMQAGAPVIITRWYPAAHIEYYFCYSTKQSVTGMGDVTDLHQYYYWRDDVPHPLKAGHDAYYIVPSNLFEYQAIARVTNSFVSFDPPVTIVESRGGQVCKKVYIFRLRSYRGF